MSWTLRSSTPCDEADPLTGKHECPYMDLDGYVDCHYWCSAEEPADYPEVDAEELAEFQSFCDFIEGR